MIDKLTAPWSDEQVEALNARQERFDIHPYTCPGDQPECSGVGNHEMRVLVATRDGWVCKCGHYKQDWARW